MFKLESHSRKFDSFIVLLLFFLFATTAFVLIIIGIKQYKLTVDTMNTNYEVRTATSYLTEKIRQHDTGLGITTTTLDNTPALMLSEDIDSNTYITYIYYYDGYLRELFLSSDAVFSVESGQPIIEIGGLDIAEVTVNSISISLTTTDGHKSSMYLSTKSS
mgnify:FL=1